MQNRIENAIIGVFEGGIAGFGAGAMIAALPQTTVTADVAGKNSFLVHVAIKASIVATTTLGGAMVGALMGFCEEPEEKKNKENSFPYQRGTLARQSLFRTMFEEDDVDHQATIVQRSTLKTS